MTLPSVRLEADSRARGGDEGVLLSPGGPRVLTRDTAPLSAPMDQCTYQIPSAHREGDRARGWGQRAGPERGGICSPADREFIRKLRTPPPRPGLSSLSSTLAKLSLAFLTQTVGMLAALRPT